MRRALSLPVALGCADVGGDGAVRPVRVDDGPPPIILRDYQRELVEGLLRVARGRWLIHVATGGGKSAIVADYLARGVVARGRRALVVTKDWRLLIQIASTLRRMHPDCAAAIGFVGGDRAAAPGFARNAAAQVVFTTIQSWASRIETDLAHESFVVVVIDELHWGERAALYTRLHAHYGEAVTFIGATATPRADTTYELVGRAYDFDTLVRRGVLATPLVQPPISTNVAWSPTRSEAGGDVSAASLRELATNDVRNTIVVETYRRRRELFGKALVFACDIEHAEHLAALFCAVGVRASVVHSRISRDECESRMSAFASGELEVLVNVAMLTHGVDVPTIQTLFLVRPTTSDILFAQMIGRGARRLPGKAFFNVVDFVDNIGTHGLTIIRPAGFLGAGSAGNRGPAIERHAYDPSPFQRVPSTPGYEPLAGLEYAPHQTFGIEFELTCDEPDAREGAAWQQRADALRAALAERVPTAPKAEYYVPQDRKNHAVWNVEGDASCGWEVTSRVLFGIEGLREVADACNAIADAAGRLGLHVNAKTGTHVHLAWNLDLGALRRLMILAAYFEPALMSLVAPSRANNRYCVSVKRRLKRLLDLPSLQAWRERFARLRARYLAFNPANLFSGYGTVEVRLHSGTIEAPKILLWVSLMMRMLDAANHDAVPGDPFRRLRSGPICACERGDVKALATFLKLGSPMRLKLLARRDYVVRNSWLKHPRFASLAKSTLAKWHRARRFPPYPRMGNASRGT